MERASIGAMTPAEPLRVFDGIALAAKGDVLLFVYQAPARLHRSRWIYDRAEELAERWPGGILGLMIVLPSADVPDAPTRMENRSRLRKLRPKIRRLATVPTGDEFRISIVRTIMRTMVWIQGQGSRMPVYGRIDDGLDSLLELRSDATPSRAELEALIGALFRALGLNAPVLAARVPELARE